LCLIFVSAQGLEGKAWFHSVDRKKAQDLVTAGTYLPFILFKPFTINSLFLSFIGFHLNIFVLCVGLGDIYGI
jgi:hypothetical protein